MIRFFIGFLCAWALCGAASAACQDPAPAADRQPAVRVRGRVSTWDGQPLAGVAIRYETLAVHTTAQLQRTPQTTTGDDGRFELKLVPPAADARERPMLFVAAKGMASACLDVPWKHADHAATDDNAAADEEGVVVDDGEEGAVVPSADAAKIEYAPETEIPDIVLTAGHRLVGRVRDAAGKPLAGVRVVARDLLEQGNSFRSGRRFGFCCVALSDASGIFDLPCSLPFGSTLQFSLDGWLRERVEPVSAASPIEVTLRPGGWIQGRVLDAEGHSIPDASVTVGYELPGGTGGGTAVLRTGVDGSFRTNLDRPGRWRATATKRDGQRTLIGHSNVLTGPRENLEIVVKGDPVEQTQRLPVRAVDKKTGKPVATFRAASVWEEYANQNANYLEYRLRWQLRDQKPQKQADATVSGPGKHGVSVGAVRVVAPGYAPATKKDVEWKEPEGDAKVEPVTLELEAEATLRGVVRDENTGAPVAGARVWARLYQDPNQGNYDDNSGPPKDAPTTGADGTFRLGGLGEGKWNVLVQDPKRPRCPPKEVDLGAAEQKADFVVAVPSGAQVAGKLRGTPIARGAKVFLSKLPRQAFGEQNYYYSSYGNNQTAGESVDVAEDGAFRFEGVSLDNHLLVLRLPSPPRHGGDLYLPLEPFRVRAAGVQREFDCGEDRPGTIRGKIVFEQAVVPFEQLVVVARLVSEEGQRFFSPFDTNFFGPRSFVGPSGEYEVRVGPGSYQLVVVDLATSLQVHDETKKIEVPAGGTATRDLQLQLARIDLELKPGAEVKEMAAIDRVEIRVISKAMKQGGVQFGGNDNYDSGIGVRWPQGTTKLGVVLPLGDATFLCRNGIAALRIDDERWNNAPLGRGELEVTAGQGAKTSCTIEVGAPPEIPDPDKKKGKDGEADPDKGDPADGGKKE